MQNNLNISKLKSIKLSNVSRRIDPCHVDIGGFGDATSAAKRGLPNSLLVFVVVQGAPLHNEYSCCIGYLLPGGQICGV